MGDWFGEAATIASFCWLIWQLRRSPVRQSSMVSDGPEHEPYRVYTRAHDLVLPGRNVPGLLPERGLDRANGWSLVDPTIWRRKIADAGDIFATVEASDAGKILRDAFAAPESPSDWAICLLIDQSGSMRDAPMLNVAASARWLSARLGDIGVATGVLGFSTVGWRGGRARQDWLSSGRPERPGRLCATLHVVYQPLGGVLEDRDWEAMLHPDILRENIDGEAIEWAADTLAAFPAKHRLLIVISDGAPVDDSTLMQNGPSYLWRHIKVVIAKTEMRHDIILGAVGVNYRVDGYYRLSRTAADLADIPQALCEVIAEAVKCERGQLGE